MISEGVWGDQTWPDNWTSVTQAMLLPHVLMCFTTLCVWLPPGFLPNPLLQDGKLSAQFEQTMVVTETGVEVGVKCPLLLGAYYNGPKFKYGTGDFPIKYGSKTPKHLWSIS